LDKKSVLAFLLLELLVKRARYRFVCSIVAAPICVSLGLFPPLDEEKGNKEVRKKTDGKSGAPRHLLNVSFRRIATLPTKVNDTHGKGVSWEKGM
jgi:hypothetical protein